MEYRLLGRSGLKVSTITMGTGTFGRGRSTLPGSVGLRAARRQIDQCIAAGVNLFDTADAYAHGTAEEILGEALKGKRNDVLISSKARFPVGDGPNDAGMSRHHLIEACEASLRRLKTDRIDLYQLHEWDGLTPLEETMRTLDDLVRAGKVRYIGCSNWSAWHIMKGLGVSAAEGCERFVSQQIHYTLQAREAEYELVPVSLDQGLGILAWSPIAGGLLSGKFRRNRKGPSGARHSGRKWQEPPIHDEERLYEIIEVLVAVAAEHKCSAARVALAWLLAQPAVSSVIVGARTEDQLADNLAATELNLTEDDLTRLDAVSRPILIYPYWHQSWYAKDRLGPADLSLIAKYLRG